MADPVKGFVERLFAEHRRALQAYFYRRIRKKSDVADLTQEVYPVSYTHLTLPTTERV